MSPILSLISQIFGIAVTIIYLPQLFYLVLSIFKKPKKFPKAQKLHKYAVLVCAHDEEAVIADIIQSIKAQDYPSDLIIPFVVADNCQDKTAEIARNAGANVIVRENLEKFGKSYALDYALNIILQDEKYNDIEAFFVFDADNILKNDYISKMNDAFDSGLQCATSFRNSKNYSKNWISGTASIFFLRESAIIHTSRFNSHIGTYISGTGFYVSRKIIESNKGWKFNTLVEDIEFSIDQSLKGNKIGYCSEAEFYDEQPETFKDLVNQRMRWCKGTHQCFYHYSLRLLMKQGINKNHLTMYESLTHILPVPALSLFFLVIITSLYLIDGLALHNVTVQVMWNNILVSCVYTVFFFYFITLIYGFITFLLTYKKVKASIPKQLLYTFLFPISAYLYVPISTIALFKKVKWKKISHRSIKL